jgi:hypothetical protein
MLNSVEQAIRERLETIEHDSHGYFDYHESAALQQVIRPAPGSPEAPLRQVYRAAP